MSYLDSYDDEDTGAPSNHWWPIARALLIVAAVLTTIGGALIYLTKKQRPPTLNPYNEIYLSANRDYQQIPFDILDATHFCQSHTAEKFGAELALAYVDEHSTRFDASKGLYKIFMIAHVGTLDEYQETAVHCFVDQYRYKLTHYRTIKLKDTSFVSKAWQFFAGK